METGVVRRGEIETGVVRWRRGVRRRRRRGGDMGDGGRRRRG